MKRNHLLILSALLVGVVTTLLAISRGSAKPEPLTPSVEPPQLVVHEWGTFTSFSGSDGQNLRFPHKNDDLPEFVHFVPGQNKERVYGDYSPISLETPVLYFYTDKALTASVTVDFPQGLLTEWYPKAEEDPIGMRLPPKRLTWKNLKLLPGTALSSYDPLVDEADRPKPQLGTLALPVDKSKSHYYAARETDAAPLQVKAGDQTEQEKFLFYRGVADFPPPLTVKALGGDRFEVSNHSRDRATGLVLVRIEGDVVRFGKIGSLNGGATQTVSLPCKCVGTADELGEVMVRSLIDAGLYEKEARAMVKTWKADWFTDVGTRLLYVAPAPYADELLPLKVEPKPASVVRVLVGRHDIISPEQEREMEAVFKDLVKLQQEQEVLYGKIQKIEERLNGAYGRFRWPAQAAAAERLKKAEK